MKILGIDTATDVCGIALAEDERLIAEIRTNFKRAHAEKLIDSIDIVLNNAETELKDLDAIAISIGPGSFTGLRIGLSTVKGLAFANDIPLVAVNTLDALACQALSWNYQICPLIHAQAKEAYTALYVVENFELKKTCDYRLIVLDELIEYLTEKTLIINNGVKYLDPFISQVDNNLISVAPEAMSLLNGFTIALIGYEKFKQGKVEDIASLEPYYLKEFKAKQKREFNF